MKSANSRSAFVTCVAVAILFCATRGVFAQSRGRIKLDEDTFAFAARLINKGHVIVDGKGAWSAHRPSANEENAFIRLHGFREYGKWHLGIDNRYPVNTKRRYKFPYGDFKNVHRCGVLAVKARARQYGYTEIENAAAELEREIKNQPRTNTDFHRSRNSSVSRHLCKSVALTLPGR
jgi:hypothetical protein